MERQEYDRVRTRPRFRPAPRRPGHGAPGATAGLRAAVDEAVAAHGAVLLRGWRIADEASAEAAVRVVTSQPMAEYEPFAPRTEYRPGLHSSTEWPPDQPMCMHHELSYALRVPGRQVFVCLTAPEHGAPSHSPTAPPCCGTCPPRS